MSKEEGCVAGCMDATNPRCVCWCGGKHHGEKTTARLDIPEFGIPESAIDEYAIRFLPEGR